MSTGNRKRARSLPTPALQLVPSPSQEVGQSFAPVIGECLDVRHPTLVGRVLVRVPDAAGEASERWLPTLQGLALRVGDRVLLVRANNETEAIAIGVVDGWRRRPEPERSGPTMELKSDEAVRVVAESGEPLLEVVQGSDGPVVRLLHRDTQVELPGKLRIRADAIELHAERGGVRIEATDDVVVRGETIQLN